MKTEWQSVLNTNLVKIRTRKKYSQSEISEVLGISQPSYNRMESGKVNTHTSHLHRLAKFYNILIDDFFHIDGGVSNSFHESIKQLDDSIAKIKTLEVLNELISKRNNELEEKLYRKNKKIETLMKIRDEG